MVIGYSQNYPHRIFIGRDPYVRIMTEAWCSRNISERSYYLHNQIGGKGWEIRDGYLSITDERLLTLFLLEHGHQIN